MTAEQLANLLGKKLYTVKINIPYMSMEQMCIAADNHKDDEEYLLYLLKIIDFNMPRFTKSEIDYMLEHIEQYVNPS